MWRGAVARRGSSRSVLTVNAGLRMEKAALPRRFRSGRTRRAAAQLARDGRLSPQISKAGTVSRRNSSGRSRIGRRKPHPLARLHARQQIADYGCCDCSHRRRRACAGQSRGSSEQHEPTNAVGALERVPERPGTAHRVAGERGGLERERVEDLVDELARRGAEAPTLQPNRVAEAESRSIRHDRAHAVQVLEKRKQRERGGAAAVEEEHGRAFAGLGQVHASAPVHLDVAAGGRGGSEHPLVDVECLAGSNLHRQPRSRCWTATGPGANATSPLGTDVLLVARTDAMRFAT